MSLRVRESAKGLILKVWIFRAQQSILLRKGLFYHDFSKKAKYLEALKAYTEKNRVFKISSQNLQNFRKK
jgi:hypothetical protein